VRYGHVEEAPHDRSTRTKLDIFELVIS